MTSFRSLSPGQEIASCPEVLELDDEADVEVMLSHLKEECLAEGSNGIKVYEERSFYVECN